MSLVSHCDLDPIPNSESFPKAKGLDELMEHIPYARAHETNELVSECSR
jgi:hypothetical protein